MIAPSPARAAAPLLAAEADGRSPREILHRHGRTFAFAGRLLSGPQLESAARLYAFLRRADDLVDRAPDRAIGRRNLHRFEARWRDALGNGSSPVPGLRFADPARARAALEAFFVGLRDDLEETRLPDLASLERYAYRVAGTVGLLMADLLRARSPEASWHAIDLGLGMQLTNIARDVAEDARAGRQYLPVTWIGRPSFAVLASGRQAGAHGLRQAVCRLLEHAEAFYDSGEAGLAWLPLRPRFAIFVAARLYREIGREIVRREDAPWTGRVVVSGRTKRRCLLRLTRTFVRRGGLRPTPHDAARHAALHGLPGIHLLEAGK